MVNLPIKAIPLTFSKECSELNNIATYRANCFTEQSTDDDFKKRINELMLFLESRQLHQQFTALTYYLAPSDNFTTKELIQLIIRADKLITRLKEEHSTTLAQIASLGSSQSAEKVSDASRAILLAQQRADDKKRLERNLEFDEDKIEENFEIISNILQLIKQHPAVEHESLVDYEECVTRIQNAKLERTTPKQRRVGNIYRNGRDSKLYHINNSIKRIVDSLQKKKLSTMKTRRKALDIELLAKKSYYRPECESIRQYMTLNDYVKYTTQSGEFITLHSVEQYRKAYYNPAND